MACSQSEVLTYGLVHTAKKKLKGNLRSCWKCGAEREDQT